MNIKLSNEEIKKILDIESPEFPKYTTQLINLANQNSQGTRPKVVGKLSDLIHKFKGNKFFEWEDWYLKNYPEAIQNAKERIIKMFKNLKDAINKIDDKMIEKWVKDLVIIKTFIGLRFQEAILKVVAEQEGKSYRMGNIQEESQGIDGYLGNEPVSIKPVSYLSKKSLSESIQIRIIYYKKIKDGIQIEF
ncbi:MAG: MjaI family restriction endonuclease [Bacteroidota bacterium]|nr:MjaI family restriction endonuclease [Bacteroidota bacterium]